MDACPVGARLNTKCVGHLTNLLSCSLARCADFNHTIRPCRLLHVAPLDERGPIQNRQRHTAQKFSGNAIRITLSLPKGQYSR
jgi:hypothetical protein